MKYLSWFIMGTLTMAGIAGLICSLGYILENTMPWGPLLAFGAVAVTYLCFLGYVIAKLRGSRL